MNSQKQSLNSELEDLFSDLELPSDNEIKQETRSAKISQSRKGIVFSQEQRQKISISGIGRVPHNKGKATSDEIRAKQRLSHAGQAAPNKQPVLTPSGAFESAMAAGKWGQSNGIKNAYKKIQDYIYNNIDPQQFRYITTQEFLETTQFPWQDPNHTPEWFSNKTRFRPVETPSGVFESREDLVNWCKEQGVPNAKKKVEGWFYNGTVRYISKQEYFKLQK